MIGHQMSNNLLLEPLPVRAPLVAQTAAAIRARIEAGRWHVGELFGATDAIAQMGYRPALGACSVELVAAPDVVARELRLRRRTEVCFIERVRLADNRPVVLCQDYFDATLLREHDIEVDHVE